MFEFLLIWRSMKMHSNCLSKTMWEEVLFLLALLGL